MYEIKDPENVIPEISQGDIIMILLKEPLTKYLSYIGFIYRLNGTCYMKGFGQHNVKGSSLPISWSFDGLSHTLKTSLMSAVITAYNHMTRHLNFDVVLYAIKNLNDLEQFKESYSITNQNFINQIRELIHKPNESRGTP